MNTMVSVVHRCGHERSYDLADVPAGERGDRLVWLRRKPCRACWITQTRKARQVKFEQERRDAHRVVLERRAASAGLPPLVGEPAARAYGLHVRDAAMTRLRTAFGADIVGFVRQVAGPARMISTASWWIAHHTLPDRELAARLSQEALGAGRYEARVAGWVS